MKRAFWTACAVLVANFSASAQTEQTGDWGPPPDEFDWIQLKSGEWLKGDLKALYDGTLEFDSDELDDLEFDFEDVLQIRTQRTHGVQLEGREVLVGPLFMSNGQIRVGEGADNVFPREQIVAVAPGEARRRKYWSGKVSLGASFQSGNTDGMEYNSHFTIQRRTPATRFSFDYLGNYDQNQGEKTEDNQRANSYFDIFLSRDFYVRPLFAEYLHDEFQNIDHQGTVGSGVGYHLINTTKTEWEVTGGLAYQFTRFDTVEAGQDISESTPALILGTTFDAELTAKIDFNAGYRIQIVNRESGTFTHHATATVEFDIVGNLDLDITAVWDRIQSPQPLEDGTVPEQDDVRIMLSLGYDF